MLDFRFAPSQWETSLQSNAVSHLLGANLESALRLHGWIPSILSSANNSFEDQICPQPCIAYTMCDYLWRFWQSKLPTSKTPNIVEWRHKQHGPIQHNGAQYTTNTNKPNTEQNIPYPTLIGELWVCLVSIWEENDRCSYSLRLHIRYSFIFIFLHLHSCSNSFQCNFK